MKSNNSFGFTLFEIVFVLAILGIIAVVVVSKYSDSGVDGIVDESVLKVSIRQTVMRAMSDTPGANWNIYVADKVVQVRKGDVVMSEYQLKSYLGTFNIYFSQLGKPESLPDLPYGIGIDAETGFVS